MKNLIFTVIINFLIVGQLNVQPAVGQTTKARQQVDSNGYVYETYENDPTNLRLYTLKNGLKVYLAQNFNEPRIYSLIAIKAGSAFDPKNATGVAHYLEHLMFNGNSKIGALDWQKEKLLLDEIATLFELHRGTNDLNEKALLSTRIDSLSYEASKISSKQEYRNLLKSMGVVAVNGITNVDHTIYLGLLPKNALEKFLILEAERFKHMAPRAFNNELEIVYEEFNQEQSDIWEKKYAAIVEHIYKVHPYGQQQVIGTSAHLRNPSVKAVQEYFEKYYVPNNMAIMLTGDLEFDQTIQLIDKTLGKLKSKKVDRPKLPKEEPITHIRKVEFVDSNPESVYMAFRYNGANSKDEKYVTLIDRILSNGVAGLFDMDVKLGGKVKELRSNLIKNIDYGVHLIDGYPIDGQSLETVEAIINDQLSRIKRGDFDESLLSAVIQDIRKSDSQKFADLHLGGTIYTSFIQGQGWGERVSYVDELAKITKQDLMAFARRFYRDNYVVLYKRHGENEQKEKFVGPVKTPLAQMTRKSEFAKEIEKIHVVPNEPEFLDFDTDLRFSKLTNGLDLCCIENKHGSEFEFSIIFKVGTDHFPRLAEAIDLFDVCGSSQFTSEELKKEYFRLGLEVAATVTPEKTVFKLSGPQQQFESGIRLLNDLLVSIRCEESSFDLFINRKAAEANEITTNDFKKRSALLSYAIYGKQSRLKNQLSAQQVEKLSSNELLKLISGLKQFEQELLYYGNEVPSVTEILNRNHSFLDKTIKHPADNTIAKLKSKPVVYFIDTDSVQAEVMLVSKGQKFDRRNLPYSNFLYFYLSDAIKSEIKGKRALAYSTFATNYDATHVDDDDFFLMYAGTQSQKVIETTQAFMEMVDVFPASEQRFQIVKNEVLKRYQNSRVRGADIYWTYYDLKRKGIDYDIAKYKYQTIQNINLGELEDYYYQTIKDQGYSILILGNKDEIDLEQLAKLRSVVFLDPMTMFDEGQDDHLHSIFEAATRSVGTRAAIESIQSLTSTAACNGPDGDYSTEIVSFMDGRAMVSQLFRGSQSRVFVNGEKSWSFEESNAVEVSPKAKLIARLHEYHRMVFDFEQMFHTFQILGLEEFHEKNCWKVKAKHELNQDIWLYFDEQSRRLVGYVLPIPESDEKVSNYFSGWTKFGELTLPTTITATDNQGSWVLTFDKVTLNAADGSLFEVPPAIK